MQCVCSRAPVVDRRNGEVLPLTVCEQCARERAELGFCGADLQRGPLDALEMELRALRARLEDFEARLARHERRPDRDDVTTMPAAKGGGR